MNREPVSDVKLDDTIAFARRSLGPTILSLLLELKSLREAQPPAGCAELAREIYKIIAEEFIDCGLCKWEDHHLEAEINDRLRCTPTLSIIAAKLAPLFARIAELEAKLAAVEGVEKMMKESGGSLEFQTGYAGPDNADGEFYAVIYRYPTDGDNESLPSCEGEVVHHTLIDALAALVEEEGK